MRRRDVDGGWAWAVLVASYMNLFLLSGVCYMGGMFQVVFLEHFQQSVGLTAWVTSLFASLMLLAGPITSIITSYFNCRVSVMLGGLLLAGGLAGSAFTTTLPGMFISFGLVAGLGLGLGYTPSVVVVNFFFEQKRTLVTSLALSASGTGLLLAPLLFQFLLDTFAWQECLFILAGICMHVTLFGALMFPLHEKKTSIPRLFSKIKCCRTKSKKPVNNELKTSPCLNEKANSEVSYSPEITNGELSNGTAEIDETSKLTAKSEEESSDNESQLDIFRNKAFLVFCVNQFMVNAACGVLNIHLPAFCESYGSTTQQIAWVLSVNGPANMVSRVLLGAFAHASGKDVWVLYFGVLLASGTIFCLIPVFAKTYVAQLVAVILIGTYLGGSYSLPPVLTIDCVGLKKLASAFGVTMIFCGLGWLVAPPIAGWFVDVTGSYDYSMYLAGVMMFLSVLVGLMVPQLVKPENEYHLPRDVSEVIEAPDELMADHEDKDSEESEDKDSEESEDKEESEDV